MTSNQINWKKAQEMERANAATERETARSNKARESETKRANLANEKITKRGQNIKAVTDIFSAKARAASSVLPRLGNDVSWYDLDPQLMRDAASVSYFQALGTTNPTDNNVSASAYYPGIMTLYYTPTIGYTGDQESSIINIAARNIYAYVRHSNSGSANYDAPDLMLYLIAMDSIYQMYGYLRHVYGLMTKADSANYYYPKAYVEALGVNFSDMQDHIADLRYYLNLMAERINSFNVPAGLSWFDRHFWLVTNEFRDHDIRRSQTYLFAPVYLYQFVATEGYLIPVQVASNDLTLKTYAQLKAIFDQMFEATMTSEDMGIISGDILKAYGSNLYKVPSVPEDYVVESGYSAEVLSQINGATIIAGTVDTSSLTIYQSASTGLLSQGMYSGAGASISTNGIRTTAGAKTAAVAGLHFDYRTINMYKDEVTPGDTMVATRLTSSWSLMGSATSTDAYYLCDSCGSEIILSATITSGLNKVSGTYQKYTDYFDGRLFSSITDDCASRVWALSKFDWAPRIRFLTINGSTFTGFFYDNGDIANYVILAKDVLTKLHNVALNSEFGIPLLGVSRR